MRRSVAATSIILAGCFSASALGAPYVPTDGSEVVERLPRVSTAEQKDVQRMRHALAASPQNLQLAVALAQRYIETSRRTGDPRYLGYAQAALAPWWEQQNAPSSVLLLRATILQSQHLFPQALADLDAMLQAQPTNAQAWLTRATILQVQGRYAEAMTSCEHLRTQTSTLVVATCLASAASMKGQGPESYRMLNDALRTGGEDSPGIRSWALTLLAELAERNGRPEDAENHYRAALALDATDTYLLGAYADFLLDRERNDEVVTLLRDHPRVDALLLRQAIALKRLGLPAAQAQIETLKSRFAAAELRGDTVHRREQARFALHLLGNSGQALELALNNWAVQKEPADARILLEAALGNNARGAARPVLDWIRKTGFKDPTILQLASQLESDR